MCGLVSKAHVRRLIPLPIDQIRPKLTRIRARFFFGALFRSNYITSILVGVILIPVYALQFPPTPLGLMVNIPRPVPAKACTPTMFSHVVTIDRLDQLSIDDRKIERDQLERYVLQFVPIGRLSVIYVDSADNQNVENVLSVVDTLKGIDPNLQVALLTPKMKSEHCPPPTARKPASIGVVVY